MKIEIFLMDLTLLYTNKIQKLKALFGYKEVFVYIKL